MSDHLVAILKAHWPLLECDHERKRDIARCSCGTWQAHWRASVGEAIEAWAEHVDTECAKFKECKEER